MEQEIAEVCAEYEVSWFNKLEEIERRVDRTTSELSAREEFRKTEVYSYPWESRDDAESFINFLRTSNGFIGLPEAQKSELSSKLHEIIDKNGGILQRNYIGTLFIAEAMNLADS